MAGTRGNHLLAVYVGRWVQDELQLAPLTSRLGVAQA